jgi:hypothetical protein
LLFANVIAGFNSLIRSSTVILVFLDLRCVIDFIVVAAHRKLPKKKPGEPGLKAI